MTVFAAGAVVMALEVLAFRIVGRTFGLAIRETSVVIAGFLTAMSMGAWLGGRIADALPRQGLLAFLVALSGALTALIAPLDSHVSDLIFASKLPIELHAAMVTMVLFVAPVLLLSMVTPFAIRLRATGIGHSGSVAGSMSAFATAGSIVGSLATALIAFNLFDSVRRTLLFLALVSLLTAIALALTARAHRHPIRAAAIAFAGIVFVLTITAMRLNPSRNVQTVFERESEFHHIIVKDLGRTRILQFGRTDQHTQSAMSLDEPLLGGAEYTDFFHMPIALRGAPRRVLFLGVGGGTGPKRFAHDYPQTIVDAVDVDPMVLDVAHRFFGLTAGPRLRLHAQDGRAFLKRSSETYDLIVVDAFTTTRYGSTVAPHMTTREFFQECAARLSDGGIVLFNSASPPGQLLTRAVSSTLRSVFPHQLAFLSTSGGNVELLASMQPLDVDGSALQKRIAELRASGVIRFPRLEERALQITPAIDTIGVPLLTDDSAPADALSVR